MVEDDEWDAIGEGNPGCLGPAIAILAIFAIAVIGAVYLLAHAPVVR